MTKDGTPDIYHRPMQRGEFLRHSLLLMVVGASCLLRPGRLVAADSTGSSKPPLTEATLNQFITQIRKGIPPDSEALKTKATRDWRALLREQFTLTSTQKRALEVLPKETVQQVEEAIKEAIHTNAAFVVRAVAAEGSAPPTERPGGGTLSSTRPEEADIAEWKKPDAVVCTRSAETYECVVKAGVVC